jgi:hypothetical protein
MCRMISDIMKRMQSRAMHQSKLSVQDMLYGSDNTEPAAGVITMLLNEISMSVEDLCEWTDIDSARMSNILNGAAPTIDEILIIAPALCRTPSHFVEYRKARVLEAVSELIDDSRNLSTLYRELAIRSNGGRSR